MAFNFVEQHLPEIVCNAFIEMKMVWGKWHLRTSAAGVVVVNGANWRCSGIQVPSFSLKS